MLANACTAIIAPPKTATGGNRDQLNRFRGDLRRPPSSTPPSPANPAGCHTRTHAHAHAHDPPPRCVHACTPTHTNTPTHTHTRAHARQRARAHARADTRPHPTQAHAHTRARTCLHAHMPECTLMHALCARATCACAHAHACMCVCVCVCVCVCASTHASVRALHTETNTSAQAGPRHPCPHLTIMTHMRCPIAVAGHARRAFQDHPRPHSKPHSASRTARVCVVAFAFINVPVPPNAPPHTRCAAGQNANTAHTRHGGTPENTCRSASIATGPPTPPHAWQTLWLHQQHQRPHARCQQRASAGPAGANHATRLWAEPAPPNCPALARAGCVAPRHQGTAWPRSAHPQSYPPGYITARPHIRPNAPHARARAHPYRHGAGGVAPHGHAACAPHDTSKNVWLPTRRWVLRPRKSRKCGPRTAAIASSMVLLGHWGNRADKPFTSGDNAAIRHPHRASAGPWRAQRHTSCCIP